MWRTVAIVVGVLALAAGVGLLTWGITSAALGEQLRAPFFAPRIALLPSEAIGWGAALLTGGITGLRLALREPRAPPVS